MGFISFGWRALQVVRRRSFARGDNDAYPSYTAALGRSSPRLGEPDLPIITYASVSVGLARHWPTRAIHRTNTPAARSSLPRSLDSHRKWLQPPHDAHAAQQNKHVVPQTNVNATFSKTCSITIALRCRSSRGVRPPPDTCPVRHADPGGTPKKILLVQRLPVQRRSSMV